MKLATPMFAAIAALTLLAASAHAEERYSLAGSDVAIWNLAGTATLEPGTSSDVVVLVERAGADAARLTVQTGPIGRRSTLRVIYPDTRVVYRDGEHRGRSMVSVRRDGTFGGGGNGLVTRRVTVSSSGPGLEAHANLRVLVPAGRSVSFYSAVGPMRASRAKGSLVLDTGSGEVTVEGSQGHLLVDTGSGDVSVSRHEGDVIVDTGSGDVRVEGVKGGTLNVDTGSGSLRASDVDTRELVVDTGSGDVEVKGATASHVHVDTGSGSVWLGLLANAPDVHVDTGSGGVELGVPPTFSAIVDLETGSGELGCDLPITLTSRERDEMHGRIADGRGRVRVDTGSGDLHIRSAAR